MSDVIHTLLEQTIQEVGDRRTLPEATYRLQFHAGFTFHDALRIVPYLRDLGVTHCYASPYLKARPGSQHGYDIVDHRQLNPEIGSNEDYAAWVEALHEHGLGQILDIVPNHMGILGNENLWWNDVLENGPASPYAAYFDIAWYASHRPELWGKVLLPILGAPYGKALEAQELRLGYTGGAFAVHYFEHWFPIDPHTYGLILGSGLDELTQGLGAEAPSLVEYQSILTAVKHLPPRSLVEPGRVAERQREKEVIKRRLDALTQEHAQIREHIERTVAAFNGTAGDRHSFDALDGLLNEQAYRLAFWRVAADEINYRRFFDVNELAALSMEREEVFAATHELVLRFLREGKVNGLRIDHPDGLYDPKQYLQRLQQQYVLACARGVFEARPEYRGLEWREIEGPLLEEIVKAQAIEDRGSRIEDRGSQNTAPQSSILDPQSSILGLLRRPLYVVVEKILGASESLPESWAVCGTTGYDFLNVLNGLFVDATAAEPLTQLYRGWAADSTPFGELVYQKKFLILQIAMASELHMLAHQLDRLAQKNRWSRDFTLHSLRHALREIIACFPVYRSYIAGGEVSETDRKYILRAVRRATAKNPALSPALFQFVRDMLLLKYPETATEEDRAEQRRFAGKFQQVTGPVTAKGLEDTAFYVYNRLVSLNEVGGDPSRFGIAPASVQQVFQERQARWPWALSAISTHDTKRSEDVRARLNVLSELPGEWAARVARWGQMNRPQRIEVEEETAPDGNDEYLLYQTLVGAWPLGSSVDGGWWMVDGEKQASAPSAPSTTHHPPSTDDFVQRIQAYMLKAIHEAKVHTSWVNPNPAYDDAVQQFVARILDPGVSRAFLDDFREFQRRVSHYGLFNSLAQTLLKIAAPGVPDTYQGTEVWDFSLVDPDNRRPVNYERRAQLLRALDERANAVRGLPGFARELTAAKEDGRIKLYVTSRALRQRREHPGLFAPGAYLPAEGAGVRADHVFGFARRHAQTWAVVVVPRLLTRLVGTGELPLGPGVWQDTVLLLPGVDPALRLRNVFTGETLALAERGGKPCLLVAEVFANFPVALFLAQP
ncbi:MAG TPA: malto-oligosyltrehalose synthase [Gemmataceae bacterium]|nr:malto-oligosyltrehalose synthase [Gemmataceae bacterium]